MRILHLLYAGGTGGIEKLCKDIGLNSKTDSNVFVFVHEGGNICNEMKAEGLCIEELSFSNKDIVPLYKKLIELVKQHGIDNIVVHHSAPLMWLAVLLYMKLQKKPAKVVVYAHNNYPELISEKKIKSVIYNHLLHTCNHIIAISEYVKGSILQYCKVSEEKISVIYNGVNVADYKTERVDKAELPIRLIFVGRLIQKKGVQVLIEALSLVKDKNDYLLNIIGDGPYRSALEEQVVNLDLTENVKFLGIQRNIKEHLSEADVFVHPAIWEEGFGITIIEAMGNQLVCVAFKKGAIPEIIQNNVSGFIVEECSPNALASKLDEIKEQLSKDNLSEMRKTACKRAEMFSVSNVVEQLHILYSRINEK